MGMPAESSIMPYEIELDPLLGEHNDYVYMQLPGISALEIIELDTKGVFQ